MENKIYTITKSEYVASAVNVSQYPAEILPEIVFIGRSNVGKSSLINSLTNRRSLAHTSQTPGKTQTINFYRATLKDVHDFYLVDLPGYGYAKVSKESRRVWAKFIEEYLLSSAQIRFVCQLVDLRHPPMDSDLKMLAWLVEKNLPVLIVATKSDKLGKNERAKNLSALKKSFGIEELPILPYSSKTREGRSELLDVIAESLLELSK
ncbi:MAG: YihA family ribosome biogenesis GTP-binding protein [Selenomonadaceae bacterium]|nr:YihA family ribosome biogenesis GTP-binding protein [Selenomonadaceae bacterium]